VISKDGAPTTAARELAAHVRSVREAEIPADLATLMRTLLFDLLAVAGAGSTLPSSRAVLCATPLSPRRGPLQPAPVLGAAGYASAQDAALAVGTIAHALELDDTFEEGSSHPAVVILPAVAALASETGADWGTAMRAAIAGYDVMCAVGVQLGAADTYARGFHPTGVAGALGAAAASALLLDLDEHRTAMALSLAANTTAGSLEFLSDGSWTKRLNAGNASGAGIRAARLAAAGFLGPETAIEGRDGLLRQYGHGGGGRGLDLRLGRGAEETSIKFYPCCRYMHGAMDLLRAVHDERPDAAAWATRIEVAVIRAGAALVADPPARKLVIETPVDAQFSMPFGAAVALATGRATVAQFDDAARVAEQMGGIMAKVECVTSDALEDAYPARWQAEVRVELTDGTVIERSEDAFRGAPDNRATDREVRGKAADLIGPSAADALWDLCRRLEEDSPFDAEMIGTAYGLAARQGERTW
jgi:2-methylcitrate dehydratase PrpD